MQTESFIKTAKPSASAKKQIDAAKSQVQNLMDIVAGTEPDRMGYFGALHRAADAAEQAFIASPSIETAEHLHTALVRCEQARVSFPRINQAIHSLFPACNEAAVPAALETLDTAIATLDAEATTAKANVSKSATVFSDVASIDRAHAAARADLEAHRTEIQRDALGWLRMFGHA